MGVCPFQLAAQSEETANLRRHAEELERHLMELREHGTGDERNAVRAELEQVGARLRELQNQQREGRREAPEAQPAREVRELRARAREMKAAGREEAARDLAEQAERLPREMAGRPPGADLSPMQQKLRELVAEAQRRKAAGDHEAARDIQRRAEELKQELKARLGREGREPVRMAEKPRGGDMPPPEEIERRLQHVRIAMENLHAAGLPDVAQHLEEVAADLERALQGPRGHGDPVPHLQAQIDELRGAVGRLAEQMERLKRAVAGDRQ